MKENDNQTIITESFEDRLTALGESEMAMFRFLLDKPAGVILTVETDRILAQLLEREGLVICEPGDRVFIPEEVRSAYEEVRSDELILRWRKRNWMYKCIEAGRYLYGVMTYEALRNLFALRYPDADMTEIMELFDSTPLYNQWFTERDGKLVALVKFDEEFVDWNTLEKEEQFYEKLEARKKAVMDSVNKRVSKQSKIGEVNAMKESFEKTATQKIRRFKYLHGGQTENEK